MLRDTKRALTVRQTIDTQEARDQEAFKIDLRPEAATESEVSGIINK